MKYAKADDKVLYKSMFGFPEEVTIMYVNEYDENGNPESYIIPDDFGNGIKTIKANRIIEIIEEA